MCTNNFNDAEASKSFANFKNYAGSKDGQSEIGQAGFGVVNATNSYYEMSAKNNYADYQTSVMLSNQQGYEQASRDVIEKSRDQIAWMGFQAKDEEATLKNNMAYRGIDTNVGTARSLVSGVQNVNKLNAENARYNAMLASFGYQNKALEAKHRAEIAQSSKGSKWASVLMSLGQTALSVYGAGSAK